MNLRSLSLKIALFLLLTTALAAAQDDSSTVRIVVDLDGVTLTLNDEEVTLDSYDSPLSSGASFILRLPLGEYRLTFSHPEHSPIARKVVTLAGEVTSVNIQFIQTEIESGEAVLKVSSWPDSVTVKLNGELLTGQFPLRFDVPSGEYKLEASRAGYEPLTHEIIIHPAKTYSLEFLLKAFPPLVQTAETMDLSRAILQTPLNVMVPDMTMAKYASMAEAFSIIPFGQGVLAKIILDEDDGGIADLLLISGALLTLGSYVTGLIISGKERRFVQSENERIKRDNEIAKALNRDIDLTIRRTNQDALSLWEADNLESGRVVVTVTEHEPD